MNKSAKISRFLITASFVILAIGFHANTIRAQHPCDNYPVTVCNVPSSFMNWSVQDNNTGATAQVGEPRPNYPGDTWALNTLWYSWTPTTSGRYVVTTQFTNINTLTFDTEIAVYRAAGNGSISNLLKLAHNDDWLPNTPASDFPCHPSIPRPATEIGNSSCLIFQANAGVTYFFQVDGYADVTVPICTGCGVGPFNLNLYFLAPLSATVSVGGRITDDGGRAIGKVRVNLTKSTGEVLSAITNPFGYYTFEGVEVGQTYTLQADSKRFQFQNNPRVISVSEDIQGEDFVSVLE